MNLSKIIRETADLAAIYAEDGAMHTAAALLREAADTVEQRAKQADTFIDALRRREKEARP